jgi:uncharacterized membrane protein
MNTTPEWLRRSVDRVEEDARLDGLANAVDRVAATVAGGDRAPLLRGDWLGHALHPLLTDLPLGFWLSADVLDLVGGRRSRKAAKRLVGLGLAFVPVTAAAGLADFRTVRDEKVRRVGALHAVGNTAGALCYWKSWRARGRGRHLRGVGWGLVGGTLAWGAGYLGGHLSFGRGVGHGLRGLDLRDTGTEPELLDRAAASELLDVPPHQVDAMVEEGLLVSVGPDRFQRADVLAVKLAGG